MIASWKYYNENEYVKFGTYNSEMVEDYTTYLTTILTNKNELRPEAEKSIMNANANRAYYALSTSTKEPISTRSRKK